MEIKKDDNYFYLGEEEDKLAILKYSLVDQKILIDSLFIAKNLKGQGLAYKLVEALVEFAKAEGLEVIPTCSYALDM